MRTALIATVCALTGIASAAGPCVAKTEHRKLDQQKIGNLQVQKVNQLQDEWRRDAKQTAANECDQLVKVRVAGAPFFVKGDDRTQVYACGPAENAHFEVVMKKPEWLLPYSGIYKLMMWVVTDVNTVCPKTKK